MTDRFLTFVRQTGTPEQIEAAEHLARENPDVFESSLLAGARFGEAPDDVDNRYGTFTAERR